MTTKKTPTLEVDVWNEPDIDTVAYSPELEADTLEPAVEDYGYDIEGLKADFPTATELERFVFDTTGIALGLKGRQNDLKYTVALAALEGRAVEAKYVVGQNPYIESGDFIPEEALKEIPLRDSRIPTEVPQFYFHSKTIPHPLPEMRNRDMKVVVKFAKYSNNMLTYEVLGPLEQHAIGEKLDKYGRTRPEKKVWVDPRTGEQVMRDSNGSFTPRGTKLATYMKSLRVNNTNQFEVFIDRDPFIINQNAIDDPWKD
tara:strand:+ start:1110 stop:1880 length:771 start_codon:yes stop_codon:yes gene_type:complete